MAEYRIANTNDPHADIIWLKEYDDVTGEVLDTTVEINESLGYETELEREDVMNFINLNTNNTFIGHVPPAPHK